MVTPSTLFFGIWFSVTVPTVDSPNIAAKYTMNDYNIISTYLPESKEVFIRLNIPTEALVGLELYNQEGVLKKLWQPTLSAKGAYEAKLAVDDIDDGTYLLNVIIDEEMYQQAVFKY